MSDSFPRIVPISKFATADGISHDTYEDAVWHNAKLIVEAALRKLLIDEYTYWTAAQLDLTDLLANPDSELSTAIRTAHLSLAGIDHPRPAEEEPEAPTELSGEGFEHLFTTRNQPE